MIEQPNLPNNQIGRRLYRARKDQLLGGVCAGLAEYLDVDVSLVRLIFVALAFIGFGVAAYLILWVVIPYRDPLGTGDEGAAQLAERARGVAGEFSEAMARPNRTAALWLGGLLILLGVVALTRELNIPAFWWLREDLIWPAALIVAGALLILLRGRGRQ